MLIQRFYIRNDSGPNRIKVNIPYEFKQIGIFPAKNRFITILKKLAASTMPTVKVYCISGQQPPHNSGKRTSTRAQQKMKMVGYLTIVVPKEEQSLTLIEQVFNYLMEQESLLKEPMINSHFSDVAESQATQCRRPRGPGVYHAPKWTKTKQRCDYR